MKIPEGLIAALKETSESIREGARVPLADELYGYAVILAAAPTPPSQEAEPVKPYWPPVQEAIKDYLDGYALDDGEVYHEPNEIESLLIHDAIAGLLGDDKFKAEYQTWLRSTNNTHAPSDKLRHAAEELVEHFTSVQLPPDCTAFVRVEKLRDALEGKS
jgi:hypothetical protein